MDRPRPRPGLRPVKAVLLAGLLVAGLWVAVRCDSTSWAAPAHSALEQTIPRASILGTVLWQRHQPAGHSSWSNALSVRVFPAGSSIQISGAELSTDTLGHFLHVGPPPGIYDIVVKNMHTLSSRLSGATLVNGQTPLDFGLLLEGDATNDDRIDLLDWQRLCSAYGHSDDAATDFNTDGRTDVWDFAWLHSNFGLQGPQPARTPPASPPAAPLSVTVASGQVPIGGHATVPITVSAGSGPVQGLEIWVLFDPLQWQAVDESGAPAAQATPGQALPNVMVNSIDVQNGLLHFAAGATLGAPAPAGDFRACTLEMRQVGVMPARSSSLHIQVALAAGSGMPRPTTQRDGVWQIGPSVLLPLLCRS